ncbi:protein ALWAYS EARLY 3-like isoform X3 [Durio zibethinus]|uniref:Protein ALWAYS EARLY 3-like isoform X3 n=1 Tax=Durio zibethinus TaxID=66656 RepID=A0A6P5X3L0_DURZI|nr:protein ALWAYS EARLY 3-like isoform X3 [Durio zibethinus]
MAPSRKPKSVNKKFSYVNELASAKNGDSSAKKSGQRKRKLSDMLGPQWTKEELEHFYEAYRKYGKDWKKVATMIRDRSVEMVEALYTMNRAYLSLPDGTASVVGLIAMMTDHYCVMVSLWYGIVDSTNGAWTHLGRGGSDSEQESNEGMGASKRRPKRSRGKLRDQPSKSLYKPLPDLLHFHSAASSYGCLSLLKRRRSESRPRAVGKRTPRVPISFSHDKSKGERYFSPIRPGMKLKVDAVDDNVAHVIALALTEASQRGGSPQVSQTPNRKAETPSPVFNNERMNAESETISAKILGSEVDEDACELSLGSTEADNADYSRAKNYSRNIEGTGTVEVQQKGKRYYRRKPEVEESVNNHLEDTKEACSGTEEGQRLCDLKGKFEAEVADANTSRASTKCLRKRSKKVLFGGVEETSFDALQTLADLSLMMPETAADTESSVLFKEEKNEVVEKTKPKGNHPVPGAKGTASKQSKQGKLFHHDVHAIPKAKEESHPNNVGMLKRRRKSSPYKLQIPKDETDADSQLGESPNVEASDEVKNLVSKGKRSNNVAHTKQGKSVRPSECMSSSNIAHPKQGKSVRTPERTSASNVGHPKQGKSVRPPERTSSSTDHGRDLNTSAPSTIQVSSIHQVNLLKSRVKRKMDAQRPAIGKDIKPSDIVKGKFSVPAMLFHDRALNLKAKLCSFLSSYQARRWCAFEWFYSTIDYPWFAKREFVEYLDHVGLGHVPRLTRVEWGVIRSSLGKPRRFSEQFLKEEREKLNQYQESVRTHYADLRAGIGEGLPTDLARPLSVGQRVIAVHPKTREIHDGSVLIVDHSRYRIQFDSPELGVEFIMDIDCMPSYPLENLPASLLRQNAAICKFAENYSELKMNGQPKESKIEENMKFSQCDNPENTDSSSRTSPSTFNVGNLSQPVKVDSSSPNLQHKVGPMETVCTQQAVNSQPSAHALVQAREADVEALSQLTRAIDKKEAVVSELRRMNDEVLENQKGADNCLKDSDSFKKQYAAVLLQLNEVNEQVSFALFCLRQRNSYQANSSVKLLKPLAKIGGHGCQLSSFDHSMHHVQECVSNVAEIVESSRMKARSMVNAAMQAMSSLRKGGKSIERIEDAIDFVNNQLSLDDFSLPALRSSTPLDSVHSTVTSHDLPTACVSYPSATSHIPDVKMQNFSDQDDLRIPSDIIVHCVATLLMTQKCTERQFPPGDVAQVLDSAVSSLKPYCSQNLQIYSEVQKCMGIIRNQILALVPT